MYQVSPFPGASTLESLLLTSIQAWTPGAQFKRVAEVGFSRLKDLKEKPWAWIKEGEVRRYLLPRESGSQSSFLIRRPESLALRSALRLQNGWALRWEKVPRQKT